MSQVNFSGITPTIAVSLNQTIPLLLDAIALEELALAHIINDEAEKTQFVLGKVSISITLTPTMLSITELLAVNTSIRRTLQDVIVSAIVRWPKADGIACPKVAG